MHVHLYEILSGMKQGVKKKIRKKVKERRLFLKRKEDILGINVLKIFPASLKRSVYFIQFVIKTLNSHVMPTLC